MSAWRSFLDESSSRDVTHAANLIVVGDAGAGKRTLVQRLRRAFGDSEDGSERAEAAVAAGPGFETLRLYATNPSGTPEGREALTDVHVWTVQDGPFEFALERSLRGGALDKWLSRVEEEVKRVAEGQTRAEELAQARAASKLAVSLATDTADLVIRMARLVDPEGARRDGEREGGSADEAPVELPPGVTRLSALPVFVLLNKADAVQASIQFSREAARLGPRARGGPEDVAELVCARLRELAIERGCWFATSDAKAGSNVALVARALVERLGPLLRVGAIASPSTMVREGEGGGEEEDRTQAEAEAGEDAGQRAANRAATWFQVPPDCVRKVTSTAWDIAFCPAGVDSAEMVEDVRRGTEEVMGTRDLATVLPAPREEGEEEAPVQLAEPESEFLRSLEKLQRTRKDPLGSAEGRPGARSAGRAETEGGEEGTASEPMSIAARRPTRRAAASAKTALAAGAGSDPASPDTSGAEGGAIKEQAQRIMSENPGAYFQNLLSRDTKRTTRSKTRTSKRTQAKARDASK